MCRPLKDFDCSLCARHFVNATYAVHGDTLAPICDTCAYRNEVDFMKRQHVSGAKCSVYGPQELKRGAEIVSWPGKVLGKILSVGYTPHPLTRRSFWGKRFHCQIIDLHGNRWAGWIAEGVISNLKPCKA